MASKQGQGSGKEGKKEQQNVQQDQGKQQGQQDVEGARRGQSTAGNQDGMPGQQNSGRPGKGGS